MDTDELASELFETYQEVNGDHWWWNDLEESEKETWRCVARKAKELLK